MGEQVLEVPKKRAKTAKKSQIKSKRSMSGEEQSETKAPEMQEDFDNRKDSDSIPHAQASHGSEVSESIEPGPGELPLETASTAVETASEPSVSYEVVDVDLECPEAPQIKEAVQQQPAQAYQTQQQITPFHQVQQQQQQQFHPNQQQFQPGQGHLPFSDTQVSNPVRAPQTSNYGPRPAQPTGPRRNLSQHAAMDATCYNAGRPSPQVAPPNIAPPVRMRGGALRGPMPVRHPRPLAVPAAPRQGGANPRGNVGTRGSHPNPNQQPQGVRFGPRTIPSAPNSGQPVRVPRQQAPRLTQGHPMRVAHAPIPRQSLGGMQQQHRQPQPRQRAFVPEGYNNPNQSARPQLRPQMMNPANGRGSVPMHQNPQQQQQQWGGGAIAPNSRANFHPKQQQARTSDISKNRNPDHVLDQDGSYTVNESGVICLD